MAALDDWTTTVRVAADGYKNDYREKTEVGVPGEELQDLGIVSDVRHRILQKSQTEKEHTKPDQRVGDVVPVDRFDKEHRRSHGDCRKCRGTHAEFESKEGDDPRRYGWYRYLPP